MTTIAGGYSSNVKLTMLVGDSEIRLSQVCPQAVLLKDACEPVPPQDASILIDVDGNTRTLKVFLTRGITATEQWVAYI